MKRLTRHRLVTFLLAFLSALLVASFGALVSAAGHGWNAALLSTTALLTIPCAAAAWTLRGKRGGRMLAGLVTVANVAIDAALVFLTFRGGTGDFNGVVEHLAIPVVAWLAIWLAWQILGLVAVLPGRRASGRL